MAGGMELHFFWLWVFKYRSLKFGKNRCFCGTWRISLQISASEQYSLFLRKLRVSASEKYFPDSGKWPFHKPPIHTPTKCLPITAPAWQARKDFCMSAKSTETHAKEVDIGPCHRTGLWTSIATPNRHHWARLNGGLANRKKRHLCGDRDDSAVSPWREVPSVYWQAIVAHNLVVNQ